MAAGPLLRIVSINDVYALDNLPRIATLVARERAGADALLVILAGDFVAPSLLSSLDHGRGMIECLNAVGVTHVVLGNHEDDIPFDELQQRIHELRAPCLAANVEGAFGPPLPPSEIVTVAGAGTTVRVGLVGVVIDEANAYRRPPFGGAKLSSPNVALLAEASRLVRDEGCRCVIAITHQTIAGDRALACEVTRATPPLPIPVIVGGHEHVVIREAVDGIEIVKTGADAFRAAVIDVVVGVEAPQASVRMVTAADYPEEAGVRALVDSHLAPVKQLESIPLLVLAPGQELSSVGTRRMQTTLGTFLCSQLRDALGAQGALFNGGGIRASRVHTGALTYGALRAEVPFDNAIVVVRLPGRVIREAIRDSRSRAPQEFGGFLQVDDRMEVDEHDELLAIDGKPLDLDAEYRIATVHTLFGGLDRIQPFIDFAARHPELIPHADAGRETKLILLECLALARWRSLGAFSSLDLDHDGRVTRSEIAAAFVREGTASDVADAAAQILLDTIDADRDGAILETDGAMTPTKGSP
ncbi:MAG: 5'-nucleotidase C-terminal domain-containing protein [Deltaproteobacteria bacterium]|nr:5'-nucleotidase C-terminal domain-containing protein [Deltaproteobacteria bacterium]